eukprot:Amastigsp_a176019_29.p4 type:complete len:110 gc:universal Amastigsp_a176019_29:274-603(+)
MCVRVCLGHSLSLWDNDGTAGAMASCHARAALEGRSQRLCAVLCPRRRAPRFLTLLRGPRDTRDTSIVQTRSLAQFRCPTSDINVFHASENTLTKSTRSGGGTNAKLTP